MTDARGFTLIELMVALAVSAVVVLASRAALGAMTDAWERARAARQPIMATVAARRALEDWLASATFLLSDSVFEGRHRRSGYLDLDEVVFTVRDGGSLYPGAHRIRLWVNDDIVGSREGLLAELRPLGGRVAAPPDTLTVVPQATGVSIRYRGVFDGQREWVRDWRSEFGLPEALELRLRGPTAVRLGEAATSSLPPLLELPISVPLAREAR